MTHATIACLPIQSSDRPATVVSSTEYRGTNAVITLHRDLLIPTVKNVAKTLYKRFHLKLANHRNPLIQDLSSRTLPGDPGRRLKCTWCRELLAN
ncbi:disrupted in renal carcinoma protein 2-like [Aphis craccivora]|uniref:Disrupted in renal carcinoma protein 2-like n=1 Tax=Aphis craccivora TaxID=307492 RepID=A0A6G0WZN4_APHCR|nr:disrupted in renal carcinoma protein 2-like [Aphis craccivora]